MMSVRVHVVVITVMALATATPAVVAPTEASVARRPQRSQFCEGSDPLNFSRLPGPSDVG